MNPLTAEALNEDHSTVYFAGEFDTTVTGPASRAAKAIDIVTVTRENTDSPTTKYLQANDEPAPRDTYTVDTKYEVPEASLQIPEHIDLTDPVNVAIWSALASHPLCRQYLPAEHPQSTERDLAEPPETRYIGVFELTSTNEIGGDEEKLDVATTLPFVTRHSRTIEYGHEDGTVNRVQNYVSWDDSLAPPEQLPDAQRFSDVTRLVLYFDGQDLYHSLNVYGLSAAETTPLAVRDVLQRTSFYWKPCVYRVSHTRTAPAHDVLV